MPGTIMKTGLQRGRLAVRGRLLAALLGAGLVVVLMLLSPGRALAQQGAANALPEADQQAILHYNLNEDVFNRLIAATQEGRAQNIQPQSPSANQQIRSLDDLTRQAMGADPRIPALVARHGFTPREFMLANLAMMNAAIALQAKTDPETATYVDPAKVNQANVSFLEQHLTQLQSMLSTPPPGG